jgi:hypothetical protein
MRRPFAALVILGLCGAASLWGYARYQQEWRWRAFTPVARSFLVAASAHDSLRLLRMSGSPRPVAWATHVAGLDAAMVRRIADDLHPGYGYALSAGRVAVSFRSSVDHCAELGSFGEGHEIQMSFVRRGDRWLVDHVALVHC